MCFREKEHKIFSVQKTFQMSTVLVQKELQTEFLVVHHLMKSIFRDRSSNSLNPSLQFCSSSEKAIDYTIFDIALRKK